MIISILSATFVWNTFYSKKNWARCDIERILVFMCSTLYSCPIQSKLNFLYDFRENTQM